MPKDRSNWKRPVKKTLNADERHFLYGLSFIDHPTFRDAAKLQRIVDKIAPKVEVHGEG